MQASTAAKNADTTPNAAATNAAIIPDQTQSETGAGRYGSMVKQDLGTLAATGVGEAFVLRCTETTNAGVENADVDVVATAVQYDLAAHICTATKAAALVFVFVLCGSAVVAVTADGDSATHRARTDTIDDTATRPHKRRHTGTPGLV